MIEVGVTAATLAKRFPRLFHMAAEGSWPSIQRHGLLSTSALVELFALSSAEREALEATHRPEMVEITHSDHGRAFIRDQKPMDDSGLTRALRDGLTPRDWYRLLNAKVFFWLTWERLQVLRNARPYRDKRQTILTIDTAALLDAHADDALLCPINSGCTKPFPHPRGKETFLPLPEYPFGAWDRKRRGRDPVVELAVPGGVPNIVEHVVRVEEQGGESPAVVLFERTPDVAPG